MRFFSNNANLQPAFVLVSIPLSQRELRNAMKGGDSGSNPGCCIIFFLLGCCGIGLCMDFFRFQGLVYANVTSSAIRHMGMIWEKKRGLAKEVCCRDGEALLCGITTMVEVRVRALLVLWPLGRVMSV